MQLSYSSIRKPGLIGQKTDSGPSYVVSALCKDAIQAGSLVVFDGDKQCRVPGAKEDMGLAMGIVLYQGFPIKPNSMVSILRSGRVRVEAGTDVAAGNPVFLNLKANTLGAVKDPDNVLLKSACFVQSAKAGDVVELELDLIGGVQ